MARIAPQPAEPPVSAAVLARVARGERVVVTRGRKAVAVVISPAELKSLDADAALPTAHPTKAEIAAIRKARREIRERGTIPWERVRRRLDTASS